MRRYLKLKAKALIGAPAWVKPGFHVHDDYETEGAGAISFYAFGSVVTVGAKLERSW